MDPCAVCVCVRLLEIYRRRMFVSHPAESTRHLPDSFREYLYVYKYVYSRYMCITMCEMPSTQIQHAFCIYVYVSCHALLLALIRRTRRVYDTTAMRVCDIIIQCV